MTQFGNDLRVKLAENHMKHSDLAEYLGVNKWSVSNWVKGKASPRPRAFNMICDLFEMSREKYTAERNPKKTKEFTPKPYVRPEVKEKVDLSENPYKSKPLTSYDGAPELEDPAIFAAPLVSTEDVSAEDLEKVKQMAQDMKVQILPKEEPFRCDMAVKELTAKYESLSERFETAVKHWRDVEEQITVLTRGLKSLMDRPLEDRERIAVMDKRIDEIKDMINYMRGMLDGSRQQELVSGVEEQKSWWKMLWE